MQYRIIASTGHCYSDEIAVWGSDIASSFISHSCPANDFLRSNWKNDGKCFLRSIYCMIAVGQSTCLIYSFTGDALPTCGMTMPTRNETVARRTLLWILCRLSGPHLVCKYSVQCCKYSFKRLVNSELIAWWLHQFSQFSELPNFPHSVFRRSIDLSNHTETHLVALNPNDNNYKVDNTNFPCMLQDNNSYVV